eukprot:2118959-Pyramimonas_sp.AAC.1
MLPDCAADPWSGDIGRGQGHADRRFLLEAFVERLNLQLHLPSISYGVPGGPFAEQCIVAPISRIPTGELASSTRPSLLSYFIATRGLVRSVGVHSLQTMPPLSLIAHRLT